MDSANLAFLRDKGHTWATMLVHQMFEEIARRRPEAPALDWPAGALTYGSLDRLADDLAGRLRRAGVRRGARVGIFAERSPELFAAVLAVLKAGGAYLCLDPDHPDARLRAIAKDLNPRLMLVQKRTAGRLGRFAPARRLFIDGALSAAHAARGARAPDGRALPESPAYVIFTSGTTGRPKGIVLEHAGLANLTRASIDLLALGPGDRVLQFSALSFDVSVWETWLAFCSGATLVLPGPANPFLAASLPALLRERRVTAALLPPTLLSLIDPRGLRALRVVVSVGERLPGEVVRRWARGRRLINGYGPAEATVTATAFETRAGARYPPQGPPIGTPLPGVRVYLLDERLRPVRRGAVGEIFIGGAGVARGYLDRPGLTRERFLPDPFAPARARSRRGPAYPGGTARAAAFQRRPEAASPRDIARSENGRARMYRTGDLARLNAGGELEFAGRRDGQLKVRGARVEPAEIEAALRGHPAVREALVILRPGSLGRGRLLACFVPANATAPGAAELRRHLSLRLPRYMIPEDFLPLRELPRTPNGKLDRSARVDAQVPA